MLKHTIPNLFKKVKTKVIGKKNNKPLKKKHKKIKRIFKLPVDVLSSLHIPNIYFETFGSFGLIDGAHITEIDRTRDGYVARYGMNSDREIPFTQSQEVILTQLIWSCREAIELAYLSSQEDFSNDQDNLTCWFGNATEQVRATAKQGVETFRDYMESGQMLKFINVLNKETQDPPWHVCSMMANELNDCMGFKVNDNGVMATGKVNIYLGELIFSNYSNKQGRMNTILHEMSHRLLDATDMYPESNKRVERFHAKQSSQQAIISANNWARFLCSFVQNDAGLKIDLTL